MKKCPYCAEEIQDEAVVCRFCNRDLAIPPIAAPLVVPPGTSAAPLAAATPTRRRLAWIITAGIGFLLTFTGGGLILFGTILMWLGLAALLPGGRVVRYGGALLLAVVCMIPGSLVNPPPPVPSVAREAPKDQGQPQSAVPARETPDYTLEAKTLTAAYDSNEVSADATYKGNLVEVTGIIDTVGKDLLGHPYVVIGSGKEFEVRQVQCVLATEAVQRAMSVSKGSYIRARGRVKGLMMNVLMEKCTIE